MVNKSLAIIWNENVKRFANRIALITLNKTWSYSQLNQAADELSVKISFFAKENRIKVKNIGAFFNRGDHEAIISILAIYKLNAVYIPLDIHSPKERLDYIINTTELNLVLTLSCYEDFLSNLSIHSVSIDTYNPIKMKKKYNVSLVSNPEELAYMIFTSGSTGLPKGVMVNHRNVYRLFTKTQEFFQFNIQDRWLLFHSLAFDYSIWEIWGAFFYGGSLLILPDDILHNPTQLWEAINVYDITILCQTPLAFIQLLSKTLGPQLEHKLRYLIFGGEKLQVQSLAPWFHHFGKQTTVVNMYGTTETTIHASIGVIEQKDLSNPDESPIGKPISDLRFYLLDKKQLPVSKGQAGELYIAGHGLTLGYCKDKLLTARCFLENPYSKGDSNYSIFYRTGDFLYQDDKNNYHYLSRLDNQIKHRGYRLVLNDIEHQLLNHPLVTYACVKQMEVDVDLELVAFLCIQLEQNVSLENLRSFLAARLPSYMLPSYYQKLDNVVLTTSGKINKKLLKFNFTNLIKSEQPYIHSHTKREERILSVWQKHFGNHVGVEHDFFVLGGHSLMAVQLADRLSKIFKLEISPIQVMHARTVRKLARNILNKKNTQRMRQKIPQNSLNPMQQSILIEELRNNKDDGSYNIYACIRLYKQHNISEKIKRFLKNFDFLFKKIISENDEFYFKLNKNIPRIESFDEDLDLSAAQEVIKEFASKSFDLLNSSLWRVLILHLKDDSILVLFVTHHIIMDGRSLEMFLRYFEKYLTDKNYAISPKQVNYYLPENKLIINAQEFFVDYLSNTKHINLPYEYNLIEKQGECVRLDFGSSLSLHLHDIARKNNLPISAVFLAIISAVLVRWCEQNTLTISCAFNNRESEHQLEELGMLVNLLPLHFEVDTKTSFKRLAKLISEELISLSNYQNIPLNEALRKLKLDTQSIRDLFLRIVFVFNDFDTFSSRILERIYIHNQTSKFDITFIVERKAGICSLLLEFLANKFSIQTMKSMLEACKVIAEQFVSGKENKPLSSFVLSNESIGEVAARQIGNWQCTDYDVISLFQRYVKSDSQKTAVIYGENNVSYKTLDGITNSFAKIIESSLEDILLNNNSGFMALLIENPLLQITTILSVIKAGFAYIPIDIHTPRERVKFIIKDANPLIMITDQNSYEDKYSSDLKVLKVNYDLLFQSQPSNYQTNCPSHDCAVYMIYTSGTTDKPKGVIITHKNLTWLLQSTSQIMPNLKGKNWSMCHRYSFDYSVWEIFGSLTSGGCLTIIPRQKIYSGETLFHIIKDSKIEVLSLTPSVLYTLIAAAEAKKIRFTSLQTIILGGEKLNYEKISDWFQNIKSHIQLINMYGITEATVHASIHRIQENDFNWQGSMIGKALPGAALLALDKHGHIVPVGFPGELHVTGFGIVKEYLNNSMSTKQRFVNLFVLNKQMRFLRTGDKVRRWEYDQFFYCDRFDRQIQYRGFRIEPQEIEAALMRLPELENAVVTKEKDNENESLVAYLKLINSVSVSNAHITHFLLNHLPSYMVPTSFYVVKRIPITCNHKIDIKALQNGYKRCLKNNILYEKPGNELLIVLKQAVFDLFGQEIAFDANLYSLGFDSMRLLILVNTLNKCGYFIKLSTLSGCITLNQMADLITRSNIKSKKQNLLSKNITSCTSISASDMQIMMLHAYFDDISDWPVYLTQQNYIFDISIKDGLTIFLQAVENAIEKRTAFRCAFKKTRYGMDMCILPDVNPKIELLDISNFSLKEKATFLQTIENQERQKYFKLDGKTPWYRLKLIKVSPIRIHYLLTMHHALEDGWGQVVFLNEVLDSFVALQKNNIRLKKDVDNNLLLVTEYERKIKLEMSIKIFWEKYLLSLPLLSKFLIRKINAAKIIRGVAEINLQKHQLNKLLSFQQNAGCSLKSLLFCLYSKSISKLLACKNITIASVENGRKQYLHDPITAFGLFWYLIPIPFFEYKLFSKICMESDKRFAKLQKYIGYPFYNVMSFQLIETCLASFNYTHFSHRQIKADGLKIIKEDFYDRFHLPINLYCNLNKEKNELFFRIEYNTKLFTDKQIQDIITNFCNNEEINLDA